MAYIFGARFCVVWFLRIYFFHEEMHDWYARGDIMEWWLFYDSKFSTKFGSYALF